MAGTSYRCEGCMGKFEFGRCDDCKYNEQPKDKQLASKFNNDVKNVQQLVYQTLTLPYVAEVATRIKETRADGRVIPDIERVIFSGKATVVFWADGTKTVVKAYAEEIDHEKGLAMAITKKAMGNRGNYYNKIKKIVDVAKREQAEKFYNDCEKDLSKMRKKVKKEKK